MRLGFDDGSIESAAAYSRLRETLRLVCGDDLDFDRALSLQGQKVVGHASRHAVAEVPQYDS